MLLFSTVSNHKSVVSMYAKRFGLGSSSFKIVLISSTPAFASCRFCLMDSRFSLATSQLEDTSVFRKIKKEIAQANTVLTEKNNTLKNEES